MFIQEREIHHEKINTAAAVVLSALSFGVFAADSVNTTASQTNTNITNIEAGSNMVPVAQTAHNTNAAAFDSHSLVAGEWN
ncbi:hypothetical protein CWS02_15655 [Enterobacter sp. EA-1]|nr:hypothetical protein CWS02_15655 [Enterobacter sp. EA-1]